MIDPRSRHLETDAQQAAFREGLVQLFEAHRCAEYMRYDRWEFAIGMDSLIAMGLSASVLRWLASMGYVEHAIEVTKPQDSVRKFLPNRNLSFQAKTCFVLTDAGASFVAALTGASFPHHFQGTYACGRSLAQSSLIPLWASESRSLSVGGVLVKRFRIASPNQVAILAAFQEEGWPRRIDDPLRPQAHQVAKCRLHDTIKCLNRHHLQRILRFRGDGTGEGVCWEFVDVSPILPHCFPRHAFSFVS
jgi:hypothetical protein